MAKKVTFFYLNSLLLENGLPQDIVFEAKTREAYDKMKFLNKYGSRDYTIEFRPATQEERREVYKSSQKSC